MQSPNYGNRADLSVNTSTKTACEPLAPGLEASINNSVGTANELFAISEDILNRLRGNPPANCANASGKPSSGPTKDGVEITTDLMYSTLRNLRAIGEYLFA